MPSLLVCSVVARGHLIGELRDMECRMYDRVISTKVLVKKVVVKGGFVYVLRWVHVM